MSNGRTWFAVLAVVLIASSGCATLTERFADVVDGNQGPGSKLEAYLAGDADTLLVEISHSPDALWDTSERGDEQFTQQLERITGKTVEIVAQNQLPSNGDEYRYSTQELRSLHEQHKDNEDEQGTVVMHALFLDGKYEREGVAGLAFAADGWAIFKGTIRDITCTNNALVCDGVREWRVTRSVAIHEAGHLFGLVNCPLEMQTDREATHQGDSGECHSSNEDSVMYWAVEVRRGLNNLIMEEEVPWQFDQNDVNDARAVQ